MARGGWTLIARFSNYDSYYWMQNSGSWWYDRTTAYGSVTSTSNNYDMISSAFWLVQGNYIKVSRSDDSSNTGLLETSSCTGGEPLEVLLPASVTSDIAPPGAATRVVKVVL